MPRKRYYFIENDYEFLIRVFPNVENLSWFRAEKEDIGIYRYVDMDWENITDAEKELLGSDYGDPCLERLKRYAYPEIPTIADLQSADQPFPFAPFRRKKYKPKLLRVISADALLTAIILGGLIFIFKADALYHTSGNAGTTESDMVVADSLTKSEPENPAAPVSSERSRKPEIPDISDNTDIPDTKLSANRSESINTIADAKDTTATLPETSPSHGTKPDNSNVSSDMKKEDDPDDTARLTSAIADTAHTNEDTQSPDFMKLVRETVDEKTDIPSEDLEVTELLEQCKKYLRRNRLTTARGDSETALSCYQKVLKLSPKNVEAQLGFKEMEEKYIGWIEKALDRKRIKKVHQYLEGLTMVNPKSNALPKIRKELKKLEKSQRN